MTLIELFFFILAVVVSFLFGRLFWGYIGWWGVLPACILGFGIVAVILFMLRELPRSRQSAKGERSSSPDNDS